MRRLSPGAHGADCDQLVSPRRRERLGVDCPAVDGACGVEHGLAPRRGRGDDALQLRRAALEGHHGDQLGDHVAGPVADDVGAEDLAVFGVDDQLDDAVFVVVDGPGTLAGDFLFADLHLVARLFGGRLGEPNARHLRVGEGRADHQLLVDRLGLDPGELLGGDDTLLLGLVGEGLFVDQVADREDLRVGRLAVAVDLDLAPLAELDPGRGEVQRLGVGTAPAGDAEVVDLGRLVAVGELDTALAHLDVLHRPPGRDLDAFFLEDPFDDFGDVFVLGGEDLRQHLDQDHLGAEAVVGGGDLRARRAGADDGDLLRLLGQRPGAPGVDDAAAELDARDRQRHPAGGEDHAFGRLVDLTVRRDVALGGQRALALDQRDLVLVPEESDPAGERFRDLGAARLQGGPVDRDVADDPELGAVLRLMEDLRRAEDRLRRDAGVVEAATARFVALDDGGLLAQLGGTDGGDITARATPDHDDIEALWHVYKSIEPPTPGESPETASLSGTLGRRAGYCCGGRRSGIWVRALALPTHQKRTPATTRSPTLAPISAIEVASTISP